MSTNCLESINRQLKAASGSGPLPTKSAFRVIRQFKTEFNQKHEEAMVNNNMNRRRSAVVMRENALGEILDQYNFLSTEEQLESVIETAYEIGSLGKMKTAEKHLEDSIQLEESFL